MGVAHGHPGPGLVGRQVECETLHRLLDEVRAGHSRVLVLRGEAGVGKTALLEYLVEQASGFRVVRAPGVQSEMELAFAGLHQLCAPMLDRLECLPVPQGDALRTAFDVRPGSAPDRFLVALAVLSLLSEVAEEQPLVCLVDDEQWLDRASAQALAFVARRLGAESVGLVFAARRPSDDVAGLPELVVKPLRERHARLLLDSVVTGPLDERVRDQIVAETRGNPLALLELLRGFTPAELGGGFGLPGGGPLPGRIEESFRRRLEALPADTRLLLLVAAADPVGEPLLVWGAAERLGIPAEAATPAADAGLLEFGARVLFRHPLVRSASYRSSSLQERQQVHRALAEVTDPENDPDRRAWHRAHAAPGPDEDVAGELERSAGRAQARGGLAAAAAFLERASMLTPGSSRRVQRLLAAAAAQRDAGALDAALGLLALVEAGRLDERQRAGVDLLRAQLAFAASRGSDAPPLLLRAAERLESLDVGLARETYLDAMSAAMFAGRLTGAGGSVVAVSHAARAAPPPAYPPRSPDLLLDGLAVLFSEGYSAGLPILKRAVSAFGTDMSAAEQLRWLWLACVAALYLWDDASWDRLSNRYVQLACEAGALSEVPLALSMRVYVHLLAGELTAAASLIEEVQAGMDATGINLTPYGALGLAALRGRETESSALTEASGKELVLRGEGIGVTVTAWTHAVLYNGLGRYDKAFAAAQRACEYPTDVTATWGAVELIEAAARAGKPEAAAGAHQRLLRAARASGTDWALGVEARSRALLSEAAGAERLYGEAIERLGRTRIRAELARAHLLYGEWLRRENRRVDARQQLRTAHEMFALMGAGAFADRARLELLATGESVRKTTAATRRELTAQEALIARLARDGLSNPDIATRLFISPRTVKYHLRKVFTKLEITSRMQLDRAMPSDPPGGPL
jgi:DNA-binding CsgD family transcriptional regulator